ncbi:MAG TPA: hypothetical protein VFJ18_05415 [Pararhizobium sp.]|nr:hypothetical protein [Pararhizobium sp.]
MPDREERPLVLTIRENFEASEVRHFLHSLPLFQCDEDLPDSIADALDRLDQVDHEKSGKSKQPQ